MTVQARIQPAYRVTDPATGEVVEEFSCATDVEVGDALAASSSAFEEWRSRPIERRAAVVRRLAELFTERADMLGAIVSQEMGKKTSAAVGEAQFCSEIFDYYASNGPQLVTTQSLPGISGATAVVERLPIGPLLGIMPWNYPYYQVARFAAPNLVLGNTIILKHAENCPRSALAIAALMDEAGVPRGAYINLFATYDQVATIIADPLVRGVSLTGSERAGAVVAELAGRHLKKVVLELGGSDPYIILDTPNVDEAARKAWRTRMDNTPRKMPWRSCGRALPAAGQTRRCCEPKPTSCASSPSCQHG